MGHIPNLDKLNNLKYHLKINTLDNEIVDITRMNCLESLLKLLHIEWNIFTLHKELGAGDFEITILKTETENIGNPTRPIFFYESKKIVRI